MSDCGICGEPMPAGEEMFKFHGHSGPCPKPPLLKPYQQRVVSEKDALDENLSKLRAFIGSPTFVALAPEQQHLLQRQANTMTEYSSILQERIGLFK